MRVYGPRLGTLAEICEHDMDSPSGSSRRLLLTTEQGEEKKLFKTCKVGWRVIFQGKGRVGYDIRKLNEVLCESRRSCPWEISGA